MSFSIENDIDLAKTTSFSIENDIFGENDVVLAKTTSFSIENDITKIQFMDKFCSPEPISNHEMDGTCMCSNIL